MFDRLLHPSLWQPSLRDHGQSLRDHGQSLRDHGQSLRDHGQSPRDFWRRQLVTVLFVLVGVGVLAWSLRIEPGSSLFYPATLLLAAVWAVGAFASGPLHLGRIGVGDALRRPVVQPIVLGLVLGAVFVVGGLLVHRLDLLNPLDDQVRGVLDHADQGTGVLTLLVTVFNGVAEELFFRGAVYAAVPRNPVLWSSVVYGVATLATGNVMLGFAAIVLGVVVALQRRASGGILAPILTHVTWSVVMLYALPAIFL